MSWREWAAAQYNHVLSIMKDTMDKTLFVIATCSELITSERLLDYIVIFS